MNANTRDVMLRRGGEIVLHKERYSFLNAEVVEQKLPKNMKRWNEW